MDILQILQTIFTGFTVIIAIVAVILAYKVGQKQNEINIQALGLHDFAEVFLMPQQIVKEAKEGNELVGWKLLIKNASSYSIYINKYTLNEVETIVGGSVIPTSSDNWYGVPLPKDIKKFNIVVEFEDHRGRKFKTKGTGELIGGGWSIKSQKREELN